MTSPCPEQGGLGARLGSELLGTRNSYRCLVPLLLGIRHQLRFSCVSALCECACVEHYLSLESLVLILKGFYPRSLIYIPDVGDSLGWKPDTIWNETL